MESEPTVFVVDDDNDVRDSLRWLIESAGFHVETHATPQAFLESYRPGAPGCVVVDLRMPGMSGIDLQEKLSGKEPSIPVIVITAFGDVATAVRAMKSGAVDFLEKPFDSQALVARIRDAVALDADRRAEHEERAKVMARAARLTRREREVMGLVVRGLPNKAIAAELHISQKTVEAHRASTMKKMKAQSLPDLVRYAEMMTESGSAGAVPRPGARSERPLSPGNEPGISGEPTDHRSNAPALDPDGMRPENPTEAEGTAG